MKDDAKAREYIGVYLTVDLLFSAALVLAARWSASPSRAFFVRGIACARIRHATSAEWKWKWNLIKIGPLPWLYQTHPEAKRPC